MLIRANNKPDEELNLMPKGGFVCLILIVILVFVSIGYISYSQYHRTNFCKGVNYSFSNDWLDMEEGYIKCCGGWVNHERRGNVCEVFKYIK